jgi:hypothetical protein
MTTNATPATTTPAADSPAATRSLSLRNNPAMRLLVAGLIIVAAVGTQLYVSLTNLADGEASGFPTSYWLQIVLAVTGVAMVVGGIVKTVRR